MPRGFRIYEKKRGHRHTLSAQAGRVGEALFFGAVLLVGLASLAGLVWAWILPHWLANYNFVQHTCTVLDKKLETGPDGGSYRPQIHIEYEVQGTPYHVWTYDATGVFSRDRAEQQAILDEFQIGQPHRCWYAPEDPSRAILVRTSGWWIWLALAVGASFTVIGGVGLLYALLHWRTSAERMAATVTRSRARLDVFDDENRPSDQYPAIPSPAPLTNSPGTRLAYRLPIAATRTWRLVSVAAFCLFWNAAAVVFVVMAINLHLDGQHDWWFDLFLLPMVGVAAWSVRWLMRELTSTSGVGPTLVEISDLPLVPGRECRIVVSQSGAVKVRWLEVVLTCDEETSYRQGTDVRIDRRCVCRLPLFDRADFEIAAGGSFDQEIAVRLPESAMHSFTSPHNAVRWSIHVAADLAGWPPLEREFPVVVYPAPAA